MPFVPSRRTPTRTTWSSSHPITALSAWIARKSPRRTPGFSLLTAFHKIDDYEPKQLSTARSRASVTHQRRAHVLVIVAHGTSHVVWLGQRAGSKARGCFTLGAFRRDPRNRPQTIRLLPTLEQTDQAPAKGRHHCWRPADPYDCGRALRSHARAAPERRSWPVVDWRSGLD